MNNNNKQQRAFSLIELMLSLTILLFLIAMAVPAWQSALEYQRLKAVVSRLSIDLRLAKLEAIKRNSRIQITFTTHTNGDWCYGWKINQACDCFSQNHCTVDKISMARSRSSNSQVSLEPHLSSPGTRLIFESTQLFMASTFGHISIKTLHNEIRVIVSRTGRIRLCSPAGNMHVAGYSSVC
jgi:type IV fimbrial biogenesis protein FimT